MNRPRLPIAIPARINQTRECRHDALDFARLYALSALLMLTGPASALDLQVGTDFEGGSARVESVDQAARVIRFMPGGDPARGWPCWWYLRVDGVAKGERVTLDLAGSDRPVRNQGKSTGKPLGANWAMPARAAFSTDRRTWRHTEPGRHEGGRIRYEVAGDGGPLWVAWGPPFTPEDTDRLLEESAKTLPAATSPFDLARTRGNRQVRGLRVNEAANLAPAAIWIQARQHAWESGSSWVARGLVEWLLGEDDDARWLRRRAEVFVVPIMDVDNAATGNGGKEADPRDHNRDWDDTPVYPEVAAAQDRLRELARSGRLTLFVDLHNPAPGDARPFFFVGPAELLPEPSEVSPPSLPRPGPRPDQRSAHARREAAGHRSGLSSPLAADQRPVGDRPRQPTIRRRLP